MYTPHHNYTSMHLDSSSSSSGVAIRNKKINQDFGEDRDGIEIDNGKGKNRDDHQRLNNDSNYVHAEDIRGEDRVLNQQHLRQNSIYQNENVSNSNQVHHYQQQSHRPESPPKYWGDGTAGPQDYEHQSSLSSVLGDKTNKNIKRDYYDDAVDEIMNMVGNHSRSVGEKYKINSNHNQQQYTVGENGKNQRIEAWMRTSISNDLEEELEHYKAAFYEMQKKEEEIIKDLELECKNLKATLEEALQKQQNKEEENKSLKETAQQQQEKLRSYEIEVKSLKEEIQNSRNGSNGMRSYQHSISTDMDEDMKPMMPIYGSGYAAQHPLQSQMSNPMSSSSMMNSSAIPRMPPTQPGIHISGMNNMLPQANNVVYQLDQAQNYKGLVQEYFLKIQFGQVTYVLKEDRGPMCVGPRFRSDICLGNRVLESGEGSSKKAAEQEAARKLLFQMNLGT